MPNNIAYPPQIKDSIFLKYCWRETHAKNSNVVFTITGKPGKGKSMDALQFMYLLDRDSYNRPRFDLRNFVFTKKLFSQAVVTNLNHRGRAITWEEPYAAGIKDGGTNSRTFMKVANLQISLLFGTMRKNNHIIFLTLPKQSFFDKQARDVSHGNIHVYGNNGEASFASIYMYDFHPFFEKEYKYHLRDRKGGVTYELEGLEVKMPPESIVEAANEKSNYYKDLWANEMNQEEVYVKKEGKTRLEFLQYVEANKFQFMNADNTYDRKKLVNHAMKAYGIESSTAYGWTRAFT